MEMEIKKEGKEKTKLHQKRIYLEKKKANLHEKSNKSEKTTDYLELKQDENINNSCL